MMIIHTSKPGRSAHYQIMRYVDGAAVAMSATRNGAISIYEARNVQIDAHNVNRTWKRATEAEHRAMLIERAVNAGYNVVEIANRLRDEAAKRKR